MDRPRIDYREGGTALARQVQAWAIAVLLWALVAMLVGFSLGHLAERWRRLDADTMSCDADQPLTIEKL